VGANYAAAQVRGLVDAGAPGVHLYPFNRAGLCLDVVERAGLMPA
jgi:methylenetetrahydrofolate reductase (NADPH)